jgi:alpha-L-fucosidase
VTTHSIAAFKNYKGGKGDIVREYVDAFRSHGLKVGLYYCFPGDYCGAGHAGDYSNNGDNALIPIGKPDLHGLPAEAIGDYTGFIKKQLTELLTNYGPIDLLWIDQYSNPYTGKDWQEIRSLVKSLQPNCLLLGNNSQNLSDSDLYSYEYPYQMSEKHPENALPHEGNKIPGEVCDKLGPGWFWGEGQNESNLQSAQDVVKLLRTCNSRSANYLLSISPDKSGLIPDYVVKRMKEIGRLLNEEGSH